MFVKFQNLLICLAVLAMGVVQVFGVQAGYLCNFTGERSVQEKCEPAVCHPEQMLEENRGGEAVKTPGGNQSQDDDQAPVNSDDHSHSEVRETLMVTGFPPVQALPAVVFFDVPPAFQMPDLTALIASPPGVKCPEPPECGSPPMPLLVARTIVMVV